VLHEYVTASARKYPDAPAVQADGATWSYRELQSAADDVRFTIETHVATEGIAPIGLLCQTAHPACAGLLGIVASGHIYVPLNSRMPVAALAQIAERARLSALLVDASCEVLATTLVTFVGRDLPILRVDKRTGSSRASPPARAAASRIAYLIFTSGSSGIPKGVPVSHENACACIESFSAEIRFEASDRVAQLSNRSFDVSIAEMFLCWRAGACLYVPTFGDRLRPAEFVKRSGLTVWSSVPTLAANLQLLGRLQPGAFPSLRLSLFCGEVLPLALATAWQDAAPDSLVVNIYGPTESSIFSTLYRFNRHSLPPGSVVPIGHALPGITYRIDAMHGDESAAGELWLAGPQVVSGYWHDPEATCTSFVTDSRNTHWYRTGDLVSDAGGATGLLFHGRRDQQVKVRGYRVEIGEVEHVLRDRWALPGVAVAPVFEKDHRCVALIAFVSGCSTNPDELRMGCVSHLPDYMVPSLIVPLEALPVGPNGKVDYQALARAAHEQWECAQHRSSR
jgi:D-alanine--poly(phosphoribitol) ligase subunit 1